MDSAAQPTCGQGLAANASLSAKIGELLSARAEVLERHTRALDPADPVGQREIDAYRALVRAHRDVAAQLSRLAEQMTSYRDMPMPAHDMQVMTDPQGQMAAYQRFVGLERELAAMLSKETKR